MVVLKPPGSAIVIGPAILTELRYFLEHKSLRRRFPVLLFGLILLVSQASPAWTQTEPATQDPSDLVLTRLVGENILSINLGTLLPLFSYNPNNGEATALMGTAENPKLSPGLLTLIRWGSYVAPGINLGLDITWAINFGANGDLMSQFSPFQPRISFYVSEGVVEIPLHIAIGPNFMSYKESSILTPLLRFGGSFIWNAVPDWGFGLNVMYWWVPELYPGDSSIGAAGNRFGNYLEIGLTAVYTFDPGDIK